MNYNITYDITVMNVSFAQFVYLYKSFKAPHLHIQMGKVTKKMGTDGDVCMHLVFLMYVTRAYIHSCTHNSECKQNS